MPAKFDGGFLEADYLALPWLMTIMRWDSVNSTADRLNGIGLDDNYPFAIPVAAPLDAKSLHARRAVPDSRQHQGLV